MFCKTDSFLPLSCMSTWTISVKASRPIRISTLVLLILSNSNWNWKWRAVLAALWGCTLTLTFKHVHNDNANMLMLSSKCFWCIDVAISQLQNSQAEKKKKFICDKNNTLSHFLVPCFWASFPLLVPLVCLLLCHCVIHALWDDQRTLY